MAPSKKTATSKDENKIPALVNRAGEKCEDVASKKSYKAKKIGASPSSNKAVDKGSSPQIQVFTVKTKSNDMVMLLEKPNGTPPFVYLTTGYLARNMEFANNVLNINQIRNRVDPEDPDSYWTVTMGNNDRNWKVLVGVVDGEHAHLNTAANRRAWAETFVEFFNHRSNQSLYAFAQTAYYAGDLTPQDEGSAPHMSQYLTIRDTMRLIQTVLAPTETIQQSEMHNNDGMTPISDVLANNEAMSDYYKPEHLAMAHRRFAAYARTDGLANDESSAQRDFEGFRAFNFRS